MTGQIRQRCFAKADVTLRPPGFQVENPIHIPNTKNRTHSKSWLGRTVNPGRKNRLRLSQSHQHKPMGMRTRSEKCYNSARMQTFAENNGMLQNFRKVPKCGAIQRVQMSCSWILQILQIKDGLISP